MPLLKMLALIEAHPSNPCKTYTQYDQVTPQLLTRFCSSRVSYSAVRWVEMSESPASSAGYSASTAWRLVGWLVRQLMDVSRMMWHGQFTQDICSPADDPMASTCVHMCVHGGPARGTCRPQSARATHKLQQQP